jgi:gliding motility-associated-like protein
LRIDSIGIRDRQIIPDPYLGTPPLRFGVDREEPTFDSQKLGLTFGKHTFYIVDALGCTSTDTIYALEPPRLFPPIYFSPNGDGICDTWDVPGVKEIYPDAIVSIYDRFGKKLIEYKGSAEKGWDGKYLGKDMPSTDYWYEINIREINRQYVGHFTLLRR